jgi:hypothetical protein
MSDALVNESAPIKFPSQRELLTAMFRGWKVICLCILIALLWAINDLHSAVYLYQVQMQVTPAQRNGDTSLNTGGGLAALANLGLPSLQTGSDFRLYLDLLTSRNIADELAKNPTIMHRIYSYEWNETTQSWREPSLVGRIATARKRIDDFLGYPVVPWHEPDGESLLGFIGYYVSIQQDPKRPYIAKIVMTYPDRQFALQFLSELHRVADNALREKALQRTMEYIAYLSDTLGKVTVAEHRAALAQALSEQEKSAMIARSGSAFAAEVFERPWASSFPSSPTPMQTLLKGVLFGAAAGSFLALLHWAARNNSRGRFARLKRKSAIASRD